MRCRAREDAHNLPSNFMSIPAFTHNQTANTPSFFEASLYFFPFKSTHSNMMMIALTDANKYKLLSENCQTAKSNRQR